jgi:hypothetical protein
MKKIMIMLVMLLFVAGCSEPTLDHKRVTTTRRTVTTIRPTTTIKPTTTTVKPTTTLPATTTTKSTTTLPITTIPTTTTTTIPPTTTTFAPTTTTSVQITTTTIPPVIKNRTIFTKDFGAKGNGIDDDTNALQAALDLAVANAKLFSFDDVAGTNRITVIIAPGIYRTTKPLVVSNREQMTIWAMMGVVTIKSEVSPAFVLNNSNQLTMWKFIVESPEIDINISNSQKTTLWDLTVGSVNLVNSMDMTLMKTSTFVVKDDYSSYYNMDTGVYYPQTIPQITVAENNTGSTTVLIFVVIAMLVGLIYIVVRVFNADI